MRKIGESSQEEYYSQLNCTLTTEKVFKPFFGFFTPKNVKFDTGKVVGNNLPKSMVD
jgi:hypothetical protein